MTSSERIEREVAGYRWTASRERKRLSRLIRAWDVIGSESQFPLASLIASYYREKLKTID